MSDEQDKPVPPSEEAAIQKEAAEAKADAAKAAAGGGENVGAVQQPANIADTAPTAPAPGEKKPLSDEEKAALKAAALEKAAAAKAAKAAGGAAPAAGETAKPAAAAKPKHEEDPNRPVWEKDPVAPEWQDGASDPLTVAIKDEFGDAIESARSFAGDMAFQVRRDAIAQVAASLKNRHKFTYLIDICGVDYPKREPRFDVVYHLHSFETNRRIRLKVSADEATPVPTVCGVWRVANWCEREAYDMFGIRFDGHPDLTRILLWEGFNGFPLRKDFPVEGIDTGSAIYPEYYQETAGPVAGTGTGWKPAKPPEPPTPSTPPAGTKPAPPEPS
ncbi:MAG TPA: NADH-quinone oxidoreductase subunit C [Thermoanaerobaculia bacterium]|nr:NADH-quinone oxidoreductase subunit C [Thermoanaerobaculia bacterium]